MIPKLDEVWGRLDMPWGWRIVDHVGNETVEFGTFNGRHISTLTQWHGVIEETGFINITEHIRRQRESKAG